MNEKNAVPPSDVKVTAAHTFIKIDGQDGRNLAVVQFPPVTLDADKSAAVILERYANARYLAAAWNACHKINLSVEDLESGEVEKAVAFYDKETLKQ